MNARLIDYTAENLQEGAQYAREREDGDMRIEILCGAANVIVRACAGGVRKTWITEEVRWVKLVGKDNPLPGVVDGLIFRLERGAAAG